MPSARRELLQRLKERKAELLGEDSIPRRPPGPAPLSFAQQRLWFLDKLEPGNPRFNILTAVRLRGRLRIAVLAAALSEVVRRHEALRTRFDDTPLQSVSPVSEISPVPIPLVDLSSLPSASGERLLHILAGQEAALPFDLARGPLLRARLLRLEEDHHVLLLTIHQIAIDRWSRGVLVREVVALYEAFAEGRPSPLTEPPIQYADFAVWQRRQLDGEALERRLTAWRERLAPPLPEAEIPADRPRPPVQEARGRMQYHVIPRPELAALHELARSEGATLFMVLLAGYAALLHRLTGQEDLIVGSPVANRGRPEIEGLIGFFLNLLPLRLRPRPDRSFRELLAETRETALAAFAHQDLPFERLVEDLDIERDLSRHPLFQTTLVLQNAPIPPLALRDLTVSLVEVDWGTTAFDLALFLWETEMWEGLEPGLSLVTTSSAALFDAPTVTRLVGHFRTLLREACAEPGRWVSEMAVLGAAERWQLLVEWGGGAGAAFPRPSSPPVPLSHRPPTDRERGDVTGAISRKRETTFSVGEDDLGTMAPATFPLSRGSFREGDGRGGQGVRTGGGALADLFAAQVGQTPDAPALSFPGGVLTYRELDRLAEPAAARGLVVPVIAERSWQTIAAILGVAKAGGAWVPISPSEPAPRRAAMLAEAEAAGPRSPACVLFTSGSTGAPRGVLIPARAIVRLALGNGFLEIGPGDRVAHASDPTFDAALFEIWGALLNGAELAILDPATLLSPRTLAAEIRERRITVLFLPTALFHALAGEDPATFAGLPSLLIGGEAPEPAAVRHVLRYGPPGRLLHLYGPTENTTFSSWQEVHAEDIRDIKDNRDSHVSRLPAGRPLAGGRIVVLDSHGHPAPVGVPGEIALGGDGLALGYARPDLTAERFVPDPFPEIPGDRLFLTGDRGRWLANGRLEILGRLDRQLKVRGFRVEPGEIEAALAEIPHVVDARVLLRDGRLVAYLARGSASLPTEGELKELLRRRLPSYLIPSAFVALPELPRTPRGKIDVASLPPPPPPAPRAVAPRTATEQKIAAVWEEVLGKAPGVEDDLFEIGGHSLDAVRIAARLGIGVRELFEARTVAGLAAR
jgi:amino acid adenylation domain-containing protein